MEEKISVGIDLGTTYSCIGAYIDGKVEVLTDYDGNRTIPSFVTFVESDVIQVGKIAKENFQVDASQRIYDAKRMIGRRFNDPVVQKEIPRWPFKIVDDDNDIKIEVMSKLYTPEDISSMVLKKLKENAEQKLDKPVKDAVITVPAYFNDAQRKGTMKAAAKAGLNVLRLISEPSAAALAYGLDKYLREKRTVLIFDLGGGTFDVSILKIGEGHFQTLSTSGDTHLGGQDFDNRLIDYLVAKFKDTCNVDLNKWEDEAEKKRKDKSMRKLREKCQEAKHYLSDTDKIQIMIESFYKDFDLVETVTRQQFENLNADLFEITRKCIKESLDGARLTHDNIDDVVMVGGSTKIPKIQEMIKESFKNSKIIKTINLDETVCVGAALESAKISKTLQSNFRVSEVTPFSLSARIRDEKCVKIINRFTPIPVSKSGTFSTVKDNQTSIHCLVYEGESDFCKENNCLGEFFLEGIPPLPAGKAKFLKTYKIDANGILTVTQVCQQTGNKKSIEINYGKSRLAGVE